MIGRFILFLCTILLVGAASGDKINRKQELKASKLSHLVSAIEKHQIPTFFKPLPGSPKHNFRGPAVFSAAMDKNMGLANSRGFCGTLRNTGYTGDIVLAIAVGSREGFINAVNKTDSIMYEVDLTEFKGDTVTYQFKEFKIPKSPEHGYSVNVLRLFMYKWWAAKYLPDAMLLFSDFRDVLFQSNPFAYKPHFWGPPKFQLTIFHETFPLKMLYRCPINSMWIANCYGQKALDAIGQNFVSCSGTTIGTRNAMLTYAHLMLLQLDPSVRYKGTTEGANAESLAKAHKVCSGSVGIDQGFHNYLIYAGILDKYMDVKQFPQGEGPVNTIGGFFGQKALIQRNLTEWGILKGKPPQQIFYNWNGDPSPIVHQYDRFSTNHFNGKYWEHIKVISDLYK